MCHVFNSKSKEQVILRFGEISITGSQLEQSLQGGFRWTGVRHGHASFLCGLTHKENVLVGK